MLTRRKFMLASAAGAAGVSTGFPQKFVWSDDSGRYGIVGRRAPELDVKTWIDASGKPTTFRIADQRGKWVFLKCFQNWCPGCHSHGFPTLQKVANAFHGDSRVAVVGVQTVFEGFSRNSQEAVRRLQLRYSLRIPMGHDPGNPDGDRIPGTMRHYRTGGTPWIIIINRDGIVVHNSFHVNTVAVIELFRAA